MTDRSTLSPFACGLITLLALSGCATSGRAPGASGLQAWLPWTPKPTIPDPPPVVVPDKLKNSSDLSLKYARWMLEIGSLPEAKRHYQRVLEEDPQNLDALIGMARVEQLSGRPDEAERSLQLAVRSAPESSHGHLALGRFYAEQQRWPQAVEAFNRAVVANPNDAACRYELAVALVQGGDVDAALPHFVRTVGDAEGHYNVAVILQKQGRVVEAEQHLRTAVAKKPSLSQAQQLLAEMRQPPAPAVGAPAISPASYNPPNVPTVAPAAGGRPVPQPVTTQSQSAIVRAGHSASG